MTYFGEHPAKIGPLLRGHLGSGWKRIVVIPHGAVPNAKDSSSAIRGVLPSENP